MKRTITLLLLIFVSNCIFAQSQVTYVKTPKGEDVTDAWELGHGMDSTQMAALSDSITLNYPNATEVNPPSATAHYNCHSFAWYRSEGGTGNVWIGWYPGNTGEDIYWDDDSYIEVSTLNEASSLSD